MKPGKLCMIVTVFKNDFVKPAAVMHEEVTNKYYFRRNIRMMNLLTEEASSGGAMGGTLMLVVYCVLIFGMLYFFAIRPQKKEQKRLTALLASMEVGDVVVTTSGFYGIVISIQDDDCIVEFGNNKNCRIPMRKSAIAEVEKASEGTAE